MLCRAVRTTHHVIDDPGWSRSGTAYLLGAWLLSAAVHVYVIMPASVLPGIAAGLAVSQTTAVWFISAVLRLGRHELRRRRRRRRSGRSRSALAGWSVAVDGSFWLLIGTRVGSDERGNRAIDPGKRGDHGGVQRPRRRRGADRSDRGVHRGVRVRRRVGRLRRRPRLPRRGAVTRECGADSLALPVTTTAVATLAR